VKNNQIHVTNYDLERLKQLLEAAKNTPESNTAVLNYLGNLLESAHIYRQEEVPPYVVTMNSDMEFRLVYPDETPLDKDKISVLTPMGAAILGLKTGDIVEYLAENKTKHLRITHISYQPEANNHYRL
jgi:regulator of nucleoside diphosphate kinase